MTLSITSLISHRRLKGLPISNCHAHIEFPCLTSYHTAYKSIDAKETIHIPILEAAKYSPSVFEVAGDDFIRP